MNAADVLRVMLVVKAAAPVVITFQGVSLPPRFDCGAEWVCERHYSGGMLHRDRLPAVQIDRLADWVYEYSTELPSRPAECSSGVQEWWQKGDCHREDSPAKVTYIRADHYQRKLATYHYHRNPDTYYAIEEYYCRGLRHRERGLPAIEIRGSSQPRPIWPDEVRAYEPYFGFYHGMAHTPNLVDRESNINRKGSTRPDSAAILIGS
jgi:hypothetical protein